MPRAFRELGLLFILAIIPAGIAGWLKPEVFSRDAIPSISVQDAQRTGREQSVLWIDARNAEAFARGHVPGAIRLTNEEWESLLLPVMETWTPGQTIIVYCDQEICNASTTVAARLQAELGIETIYVLKGGWSAWRQANQS
jgi:rhodanese-related sulfurtransferase